MGRYKKNPTPNELLERLKKQREKEEKKAAIKQRKALRQQQKELERAQQEQNEKLRRAEHEVIKQKRKLSKTAIEKAVFEKMGEMQVVDNLVRENIVKILKDKGMTQIKLAEKMNISQQHLQAYLKRDGRALTRMSGLIAYALEVTPQELMLYVPQSKNIRKLVTIVGSLPDQYVEDILEYAIDHRDLFNLRCSYSKSHSQAPERRDPLIENGVTDGSHARTDSAQSANGSKS